MTTNDSRWLLAIDTSSEQVSIALTDGLRTSELSWHCGRNQTVAVLSEIDHLLDLNGIERTDLAAVGVAIGPGTFNGLRVGLSIAKGLHLGLGLALIGVSTLEVTAAPFLGMNTEVVAIIPAGRGRIVWQLFEATDPPVNGTIAELGVKLSQRTTPHIVAGEFSDKQAAELSNIPLVTVPPRAIRERRAAVLAELAWSRFVVGDVDDPITLAPLYIHGNAPPPKI